jgi:hypothetical protein
MFPAGLRAQDIVVPAGTLLHCTLNEPNLSSATVSVGDPILCHLSSLQEFGHVVFPRGSYLGGHVESYKEPGHFFGKGNIKLTFDRIGLPASDIPVPSKITSVSGFHVDRKGEIIGHGHAKRDTVEWLFPPLWPWKVITLPARGPRPTLKSEEQITLRLMDDIVVPRSIAAAGYYGGNSSSDRPPLPYRPSSFQPTDSSSARYAQMSNLYYAPPSIPAIEGQPAVQVSTAVTAAPQPRANENPQERVSLIALKSGEIYAVARYRVDGSSLSYELPSGEKGSIDLPAVDWRETSQLNGAGAASPHSSQR